LSHFSKAVYLLFAGVTICVARTNAVAQQRHGGPDRAREAAGAALPPGPAKVDAMVDGIMDRLSESLDGHWHQGEYNRVVNLYRMEAAARPWNLNAYADGGWLLWSLDRDDDAVGFYLQGLKANPDTFFMYDELGQYYYQRKKDYQKAAQYYEQAVQRKGATHITMHMLAHSYERSNQLDKALDVWERAAKVQGNEVGKTNLARVRRLVSQRGKQ
jgi:tetratricopeptide (TPR) repeat protein